MTNRRALLGMMGAAVVGAAQRKTNSAQTVHRQPLPPPFEGWVAEFVEVTMVPGPGYAPHHHNGFVLGYVIDGTFRFGIEGQPERELHPGQAFYEPPGASHTVSASASTRDNARILAIVIAKQGEKHDRGDHD